MRRANIIRAWAGLGHQIIDLNGLGPGWALSPWAWARGEHWFAPLFSFSAMLSINFTTSFRYSSKLLFFQNIVTNFNFLPHLLAPPSCPTFPYRRPTSYLHKEIFRRKKSNFVRRVFIFVLPLRNKSPFSGKIIISFKNERMSLNLLTIWPKHKIEMQTIYDGISTGLGIRVSGLEYRKMEHRETLWVLLLLNRENRYVSKRWHPSFKC